MDLHIKEVLALTGWSRTRLYSLKCEDERLKSVIKFGRACWRLESVLQSYAEQVGEDPPTRETVELCMRVILQARLASKQKPPKAVTNFTNSVFGLR